MEAGTSGFLCVSDSDRRVPAELGQESQASSCLRKGLYDEKDFSFLVLVLGVTGLPRTSQLQLLQCQWLKHRLGLL